MLPPASRVLRLDAHLNLFISGQRSLSGTVIITRLLWFFQVRVPSSERILFRSELSPGERQRRLQTVQERALCPVLRLQLLQVSELLRHLTSHYPLKLRTVKKPFRDANAAAILLF